MTNEMIKLSRSYAWQWESEVQRAIESLEEDDQRHIKEVSGSQQPQSELYKLKLGADASSDDAQRLDPVISHLRTFSLFFAESAGNDADIGSLWGMLSLVIQLASEIESGLSHVIPFLKSVAHRAEIFSAYCKHEEATDVLCEAIFDAHMGLLRSYTGIIDFFRKKIAYQPSEAHWEPLDQIFRTLTSDLDQALKRMETLSSISKGGMKRLQSLLSIATGHSSAADSSKEKVNLPCIVLPAAQFSFPRSYNREGILSTIREYLGESSHGFRSLALHGVGGVGKSHIAHKFAYLESQKKTYDAMLWIHSDTESAIKQSFSEIAVRLELPGTNPQSHAENRIRVLTWLQQTSCSWLLIFDNAEVPKLLENYWPMANRGHAIITTRNHSFAFSPADRGIEVTSFQPDAGSRLLLQLLSLDITKDVNSNEAKSALELSEKLHGHALAISQMAGLIHRRSWTIEDFLTVYEKGSRQFNNKALDTVWRLSFESLDAESSCLLGVVAFIAPDSIPQALFEENGLEQLPDSLQFLNDGYSFSEVLENLMTLALLKRDKDTREFSVHRLVQQQFMEFMPIQDKQQAFWNSAILLLNVFPHSGGTMANLFNHWGRCRLYLQHVLTLARHYKISSKAAGRGSGYATLKANLPFCRLLAYCSRYLCELVDLKELDDLSQVAIDAYATLEGDERDTYINGLIQNQRGWYCNLQGNFELAGTYWRRALDLHESITPRDYKAVAWRASNMGVAAAGKANYEEALEWQKYAERSWQDSGDGTMSCLAFFRSQCAQVSTFLGRRDEARRYFDLCVSELQNSKQWGWLAYALFAEGGLLRDLAQIRQAENKYLAAQEAWKTGDQTKMHDFYAACLYKRACLAMDQADFYTAKEHLETAREITRLQSGVSPPDYLRILNKLYQLSTLMPTLMFDQEITQEGRILYEKTFGLQSQTDFVTREQRFDSLVHINWR